MARAKQGALRWATVTAYGVFALLVFAVALVVTFPVQPVVGRLTALAAARTGWQVDVVKPHWFFPAGLAAASLDGTGPAGESVALKDLKLRLSPWRLKNGTVVVDHDLKAYGGRATGHLEVVDAFSDPGYRWKGQVRRVALAQLPPPPPKAVLAPWVRGYRLDGTADLEGQAGWRGNDATRGQGEGTVDLTGVSVTLPQTQMGELTLPVGQVHGEAKWQRGRVELSDLTIDGDLVRGRGSGLILLGHTPQVSRLDLRFNGTLEQGFPMRELVTSLLGLKDGAVTITVKGTVARPLLFVNGKSVDRLLAGGA